MKQILIRETQKKKKKKYPATPYYLTIKQQIQNNFLELLRGKFT